MERLCVLVYETSEAVKETLRELLVAYAIGQDVEVIIKWLKQPILPKAVQEATAEAQIALVNADIPEVAVAIGRQVYAFVPDCSLIYYGSKAQKTVDAATSYFSSLYPARPVRYLDRPNRQQFAQVLQEMTKTAFSPKRFCWENKGMRYRIPYESILYFRSDRNYVYIHLTNGVEYPFLAKLTNVEQRLPENRFARIHQSYLVSADKIDMIDKGRKTVLLSNGEELFISKAHYKETVGI